MTLAEILDVFEGSDGDKTKALYARLEARGPMGVIALNLFRAQKNSMRAKVYRGGQPGRGSYRNMAYNRKQWAMDNLCAALTQHAETFALRWGWKPDHQQDYHAWVLYVELPTGQVSFHTATRGSGPHFPGEWDGVRDAGPGRILQWVARLETA